MKLSVLLIVLGMFAASCSGGSALTEDQIAWCTDNSAIVDETATELGLLDFVAAFYDAEGDGVESNGEPKVTDRNIEISEELKTRNELDPDALFDNLFGKYLEHGDGEKACAAAYEAEASQG